LIDILFILIFGSSALKIFKIVKFCLEFFLIIFSPLRSSIVFSFYLSTRLFLILRSIYRGDVTLLGSTNPGNSLSILPLSLYLCLIFYAEPNASSVWFVIFNLANVSVTICIYFCSLIMKHSVLLVAKRVPLSKLTNGVLWLFLDSLWHI
jgi:hypothetical protein